jgi:general stress protein 26
MARPQPAPIDPKQIAELALAVIKADPFPDLATMDGDQPRVRPVSPVRTDHFTVYVANLRSYHKTAEIAGNPKVELCYLAANHDQVRITGLAEVVTDRAVLQQIWDGNPLLRQYLGSIDNPELIVYRIEPARVRFMKECALEYYEVPVESRRLRVCLVHLVPKLLFGNARCANSCLPAQGSDRPLKCVALQTPTHLPERIACQKSTCNTRLRPFLIDLAS